MKSFRVRKHTNLKNQRRYTSSFWKTLVFVKPKWFQDTLYSVLWNQSKFQALICPLLMVCFFWLGFKGQTQLFFDQIHYMLGFKTCMDFFNLMIWPLNPYANSTQFISICEKYHLRYCIQCFNYRSSHASIEVTRHAPGLPRFHFLVNWVEHQKRTQTTTKCWPFGFVFGVQLSLRHTQALIDT